MLKILVNAYACSPNMGSEPGMAWNWCINLARYCELHIITEGEFKDKIERELAYIPQRENMHFYYSPVSEEVRRMCWNQGDWRFYKYYKAWQYKTFEIALNIIETTPIDIVHQLNMIGFREPGYLWKIEAIPFVWGPVDAKGKFPTAYLVGAGIKTKLFTRLKNVVTILQLRYQRRVRLAARRASVVVSASSNSQYSFMKYFNITSPLLNETGCYFQNYPLKSKLGKESMDILWVGKLDFRKQLELALTAILKVGSNKIKLHIVGGGDEEKYKLLASTLGIEGLCTWYGIIPHLEVQKLMQNSDLLFFTSVAEGTPHVVLEAISNNLPILCFDTCGQGDVVNESVGVKIPVSNIKQSVFEFAEQLKYFISDRTLLQKLSENCKQRQFELSWDNKAKQMVEIYKSIL